MKLKSLLQGLLILSTLFIANFSSAQTITVYHPNAAPDVGFSRTIAHTTTVAFPAYPANGSGPCSMAFAIHNSGGPNLVPASLNITGPNAADFSITSAPSLPSIPAGTSTIANASYFTITYTPSTNAVESAVLTINSNATNIPGYIINLLGPGRQLYGAKNPPFGTSTITTTPVNPISCLSPYTGIASPCIGRTGGLTYNISAVQLAGRTTTYWGPEISRDGNLQLKLSLNGNFFGDNSNVTTPALVNSDREVLTFDITATNTFGGLANGYAVFTGTSTRLTVNFGLVTSGIRCILRVTQPDDVTPRALVNPTTIGLSEQVGGLLQLTGNADNFHANYKVEAFQPNTGTWRPYLDYYDDNSFYQNGCGVCAFITTSSGFYWNNLAPRNTANNPLIVAEGGTGTILSPANMNMSDDEDLPAFPNRMVYNFNSNPVLNFGTGVMKKSGVVMTPATTFTLQDLQNNLITYEHNGSETIVDQFQFSARDSRGALMNDGNPANTNFSFGIIITPVNDVPVTRDTTFTTSFSPIPVTNTLVAYDPDLPGDPITFSIVTPPTKGTITGFNATTGQYTYTPNFGAPTTDFFTFRVFDGTVFSNTSTVNINQINLPPTSSDLSLVTQEDIAVSGTLTGTDPEGSAVSFNVVTSPAKGTLTSFNGTTGNFTYTPTLTKFGADFFTFRAQDAQGGLGQEDTVFVRIIPRLDPGDILVLDRYLVRLYDPATAQDTIITAGQGLAAGGVNLAYRNGTSIFMFDRSANGLIKANPLTGNQSPVAPLASFSTGPLGAPMGLLINNTGKIIVANPMPSSNILSVDSTTGATTVLFSGGNLGFPTGVVYLANGDLLVTDATLFLGGASKVIRITPAGVQSVVTSGGFLTLPLDLALIDQNTLVIADGGSFASQPDRIIKVNLTTGVQTVLSIGGNLFLPSGLDYRLNKLYVVNNAPTRKVLDIDPVSGVQTILPGSQLTEPWGLLIVPDPCTAGTWIGTANTDWFNAANWSCNTLPTATTDVTIPAGTPFQPVIGSPGTAQVRNLSILTGATLTNNSTLNINGGGAVTTAGIYKGSGTFTGAVYNNTGGIVSPGLSPGCTVFGAGYTNGTGTEVIEIGGTTVCTQYDQLQVVGTATLSGTLDVQLFGGFIPSC
ncbi:MAG: hypothetical protein IPL54_14810 [Chitinophagaceae bacterium]|nr:hypothetical protein [Chitinophagaceae bacterium]